jgi:hypothetical protein
MQSGMEKKLERKFGKLAACSSLKNQSQNSEHDADDDCLFLLSLLSLMGSSFPPPLPCRKCKQE